MSATEGRGAPLASAAADDGGRGWSPTIRASRGRRHCRAAGCKATGSARASSGGRCCAASTCRSSAARSVGLLGPNGAGKTTCFYIITGLIAADTGVVSLDGQDITDLPMYRRARRGIGYLPQEASIFRGLTVEQNIRAILEVVEPERERARRCSIRCWPSFRSPICAAPRRWRCRAASAAAARSPGRLATQPHFILLDEPLAGIDPIAVGDIRDLIGHLKDRGIGVLITDHNVRETLEIVDRAYILHAGQVLMEGEPAAIVADADVRRVFLGDRFSL